MGSSQPESSSSSFSNLESTPISGLYIDLPFESVSISNPLYQSESVSETESVEMAEQKNMREYMRPERTTPLGPIVLPTETVEARNAFTVKPGTHNALPLFYGRENEDPYEHVPTLRGWCAP